jgi:flagellar FliL protein
MASKDKVPQAEDDAETAAEGDGAAPKKGLLGKFLSKKMLMIAVPALVVVLAGVGTGTYFFVIKPHGDDKNKIAKADEIPLTPPQVAFSDVPDILVNIQSNDGTPAYLKLSLSLEMDNDLAKAGMTVLMPRMVDQFQAYLRELRLDDLKGSEGVLRLKDELLRRAGIAAAPYKVRDVLLKQMIVQ